MYAVIAQLVEHKIANLRVPSSTLGRRCDLSTAITLGKLDQPETTQLFFFPLAEWPTERRPRHPQHPRHRRRLSLSLFFFFLFQGRRGPLGTAARREMECETHMDGRRGTTPLFSFFFLIFSFHVRRRRNLAPASSLLLLVSLSHLTSPPPPPPPLPFPRPPPPPAPRASPPPSLPTASG